MATGTVVFQTSVTATPPSGLAVMADAVNDTDHGAGTAQYVKVMDGRTGGTIKQAVTANGAEVDVTRVQGTVQALGTVQPLAGSVHLASSLPGTAQVLGTIQAHGTTQALGTFQPLAGSVHLASGTVTVLGTIQAHGTTQALGTVQPLAGSVHVANTAAVLGSVSAQGYSAHDGAMVGNPVLLAGYGSSGTQAASHEGSVTRLWADLNGRLQVRGTIDSIPNITVSSLPTITGTVQTHGTSQVLGSVQTVGTSQVLGSVQTVGTSQVLGTTQPLAGSVHLASNLPGGSINAQGVVAHDAAAGGNPLLMGAFGTSGTQAAVNDGDAVRLWADLNGRLQIRGTIDSMPAVNVSTGTIPGGTIQAHGTTEVLGTVRALTSVTVTVGTIAEGTINNFTGTIGGGTFQPLLGTMVALGSVAHGAAADSRPVLMAAFGTSGTQVAVDDGDAVRLWADLNGRLQVRGTIDSLPNITVASMPTTTVTGTVQTHGTSQVLGSVQTVGTSQVLGTLQPLAGSVHLATNLAGGTIVAVGSAVHDAAADTRPLLMGAFGTSGTQAAVNDGDAVRLWADLNGRLQVRGTVDSLPSITGTASIQGLTAHAGGGGSANPVLEGGVGVAARPGTVNVGSVTRAYYDLEGRQVVRVGAGTTDLLGTAYTGAAANGTVLTGRGAGSYMRIYDLLISGSAAGTIRLLEDGTVRWGPIFLAANGGWNMNSAVGVKLPNVNTSLVCSFTAGTWSLTMHYGVEGA